MGVLPLAKPDEFKITPSITYNGVFETLTEVLPLIRILERPPGRPELTETLTPVTLPAIA